MSLYKNLYFVLINYILHQEPNALVRINQELKTPLSRTIAQVEAELRPSENYKSLVSIIDKEIHQRR